jgi:hypothetical protein
MKTTLDLPDDLLAEAKMIAASRRITLRAMVEHALRREIAPPLAVDPSSPFEINELGMLVLKKTGMSAVTDGEVQQIIDHQHDEEDAEVIATAQIKQ